MKVVERRYSYFTKETVDRLNDLARCAVQKVQSIPIVDLYTEHPIFRINSKNLLVQYKEFDEGANLIREARYAYDALGRRIEKVVTDLQIPSNNKTRRYVYDGEDILKVFDESNNVLSKYTHSSLRVDDALVIDDKVNNKSYYFLKDHLGSVIDIVNDDLSFKQHYAYSSFGELQKVTDIGGNDVTANPALEHHFTYTGREYDFESGLYHYRARAYDASIGRFLQVDPDPGNVDYTNTVINKYIGLGNDPIKMVDPDGRLFGIFKVGEFISKLGVQLNRSLNDITLGVFGKNNVLTGSLTELMIGNFGVLGLTFMNTSGLVDESDAARINRIFITAALVGVGAQHLGGEAFSLGGYSLTGFQIAAGASVGGTVFSQLSGGGNILLLLRNMEIALILIS